MINSAPRHAVQILKEFTRLIRLETGKHHAIIESSVAIDDSTRSAILKALQHLDGGEVSLETKIDPSLIGGSRIRLGSEVWDATVQSRLLKLDSARN